MKTRLIYGLLFLCIFLSRKDEVIAQDSSVTFLSVGGGSGTVNAFHAQLGLHITNHAVFGFHYLRGSSGSDRTPADYSAGLSLFEPNKPQDVVNLFGLSIGYTQSFKSGFRYILAAGPVVESFEEPSTFVPKNPDNVFLAGNYSYKTIRNSYPGFMLHPQLLYKRNRIGFNLGATATASAYRSDLIFEAGIVFGSFRD